MLIELIRKNRSYRRFRASRIITEKTLREFVNFARLSASGSNLQPLKYILSSEPENNEAVFQTLSWAGYLKEWDGPENAEKPSAYIIVLGDTQITNSFGCDHGIAAQSILLGAAEKGLGGCMIGSIDRIKLRSSMNIPKRYKILLVIALGEPAEKVKLEKCSVEGDIKYWRDKDGIHHVPKRTLEEIVLAKSSNYSSRLD